MAINPMLVGGIGVGVTAAAVTGGLYAGGVIGGSQISQGGTSGEKTIFNEYRGPAWQLASNDANATANYGNNTYANKYKRYLIGIDASAEWWNWSYDNRYKNAQKTQNKGFATGIENGTKLKEICKKAYKGSLGTDSEITGASDDSASKYPETEVWMFCSPAKTKIKTLKEETTEKSKYSTTGVYAAEQGYDEKLVSTEDTGSKWFWELKEEEFFGANVNPAETGKTASEFGKLWTEANKNKYKKDRTSKLIREVCKAAYNTAKPTTEDATTKYPKADVGKFCTLEGTTLS